MLIELTRMEVERLIIRMAMAHGAGDPVAVKLRAAAAAEMFDAQLKRIPLKAEEDSNASA